MVYGETNSIHVGVHVRNGRKEVLPFDGEMKEFHRRGGQIDASKMMTIIPHEKTKKGSVFLLIDCADSRSPDFSPDEVKKFLDTATMHEEAVWLILGQTQYKGMEKVVEYWALDRHALKTMLQKCTTLRAGRIRTHCEATKGGDGKPTSWVDTQFPDPDRPRSEIIKLGNCYGTWKLTPEEFNTLNGRVL